MGEGRWRGVLTDDISPSQWPPLLIRPYCQIITPLSNIFFFPNTEKKGRGKVGGGGKNRNNFATSRRKKRIFAWSVTTGTEKAVIIHKVIMFATLKIELVNSVSL